MSFFTEVDTDLYRPDAFSGFDAQAKFTLGNARAMMWMCQLAYETAHGDKIDAILNRWQLTKIDVLERAVTSSLRMGQTRGIIAATDKATIVAFAGTDPVSVQDWVADFTLGRPTGDIHAGFDAAAAAVQDRVRQAIAGGIAARRKLFITGHSLGGAIGFATALRMIEDRALNLREAEVYSFGAPRTLRPGATARYAPLMNTTYRLVHGNDVVPSVPPPDLDFGHVGRPLLCPHGGPFDEAKLPQSFDDVPRFERQLLRGLLQFVTGPLDLPFRPRPFPIGPLLAALPPGVIDHVPDAYLHALGTPIMA